jgi:hypothetical protein
MFPSDQFEWCKTGWILAAQFEAMRLWGGTPRGSLYGEKVWGRIHNLKIGGNDSCEISCAREHSQFRSSQWFHSLS